MEKEISLKSQLMFAIAIISLAMVLAASASQTNDSFINQTENETINQTENETINQTINMTQDIANAFEKVKGSTKPGGVDGEDV